jgi:hypothetical protein
MSFPGAALYRVCIALWVGGMFAVGYMAAPMLFARLPDRMLAGDVAGSLFTVQSWVAMACAVYVLLYLVGKQGRPVVNSAVFRIAALMLLLTLIGHFGIQPVLLQLKAEAMPLSVMASPLRDQFALWHGASSLLFVAESLLGLWLVAWQDRPFR